MNKKIILSLTVLLLLLIGCNSSTQDEPQASPPDNATETAVEIDDATTEDVEPTAPQEVATKTPAEIDETTSEDAEQTAQPDVAVEAPAESDDTIAQDDPQAFPPEVVAELQAEMDALTAEGFPPGVIMWIDAPLSRYHTLSIIVLAMHAMRVKSSSNIESKASPVGPHVVFLLAFLCGHFVA